MKVVVRRLEAGETDHERLWGWLGLAFYGGAAAWVHLLGLPSLRCHFRALIGCPCPSCGSTRAFAAFLHGAFWESFRWNPAAMLFFVFLAVYLPYALVAGSLNLRRVRLELDERDWRRIRWLCPLVLCGVWGWLIADGR